MPSSPEASSIPIHETIRELDPLKVQQFEATLQRDQNLPLALLAGAVAAVVGASLWAAITLLIDFQMGWMAVAIGFLVGWAVRTFGKGLKPVFGYLSAALALVGCLLGNLGMMGVLIAHQDGVTVLDVVLFLALNPALDLELLGATFSPIDLLFYGLALYYGYKTAFRRITAAEQDRLYQTRVVSSAR